MQIDGKMFLYLAGAVMLSLHLLGGATLHAQRWGGSADYNDGQEAAGGEGLLSRAMMVYLCCFGWFCVE